MLESYKEDSNHYFISKIETVFYVLKNFGKPFRKEDGTIIDSIVLDTTLLREILIKITNESYVNTIENKISESFKDNPHYDKMIAIKFTQEIQNCISKEAQKDHSKTLVIHI